jgi:hypothetical protein
VFFLRYADILKCIDFINRHSTALHDELQPCSDDINEDNDDAGQTVQLTKNSTSNDPISQSLTFKALSKRKTNASSEKDRQYEDITATTQLSTGKDEIDDIFSMF